MASGMTIPKLLPITGTFILPFTIYNLFLQGRVVSNRLKYNKLMGDVSQESASGMTDPLTQATRAQGNFAENIPLCLLFAGVVELNGGDRSVLTYSLAGLLIARVMHAEFGIMQANYMGIGRPIGYYGTLSYLAGLGAYAAYLVKGYWGF